MRCADNSAIYCIASQFSRWL